MHTQSINTKLCVFLLYVNEIINISVIDYLKFMIKIYLKKYIFDLLRINNNYIKEL